MIPVKEPDKKKYTKVLRRRMDHLAKRIAENPTRNLSYDRHELSALRWVLNLVEAIRWTG